MKPTLKYYKKLSEDYEKLLLKSVELTREVLVDSKRNRIITNLFHFVFFILGIIWGLMIVRGFS